MAVKWLYFQPNCSLCSPKNTTPAFGLFGHEQFEGHISQPAEKLQPDLLVFKTRPTESSTFRGLERCFYWNKSGWNTLQTHKLIWYISYIPKTQFFWLVSEFHPYFREPGFINHLPKGVKPPFVDFQGTPNDHPSNWVVIGSAPMNQIKGSSNLTPCGVENSKHRFNHCSNNGMNCKPWLNHHHYIFDT